MTEDGNGKQQVAPIGMMSLTTVKLVDALKDGKPGDTKTDEELSAACGRPTNVTGKGYANLVSAMRHVTRMHGTVWQRVRGENRIQCLTPLGIRDTVRHRTGHTVRVHKGSVSRLDTVDTTTLNDADRQAHVLLGAICATAALVGAKKTEKALAARDTAEPMDMQRLLVGFAKG